MGKFAIIAISTITLIEVRTDFCLVEVWFVAEFLLVVGEVAEGCLVTHSLGWNIKSGMINLPINALNTSQFYRNHGTQIFVSLALKLNNLKRYNLTEAFVRIGDSIAFLVGCC